MKRKILPVAAFMAIATICIWASVSLAQSTVKDGNTTSYTVPVGGMAPSGARRPIPVTEDGGAVPTVAAISAPLTEIEFCASATFDALALYDGGLGTYSAYTMPAGLRAFEQCNTSTAATTSTTCGVATPVIGKMGKMLPYRSGASGPPNCQAVDITFAGCPKLYILASAAQTSGSDGGTGCERLRIGQ